MKRFVRAATSLALALATTTAALAEYRAPGALPAQAAPRTAQAAKPVIKVCTGRADGVYFFASQAMARFGQSFLVQPVLTEGALENVQKVTEGVCDAAFVQNDALRVYKELDARAVNNVERGMAMYKEYAHLLCNRSANIRKITDLRKGHVVAIGSDGTGAAVTWQALVAMNKKVYGEIETSPKAGLRGLTAIQDGSEVTCTLYVGGLGNALLKKDAQKFADKVVLVPVTEGVDGEKDAAGRPIYTYEEIPHGTYGALMPSGALWGTSAVKTFAVDAVFVANAQWADHNGALYENVLRAVTNALPAIRDRANPKQ